MPILTNGDCVQPEQLLKLQKKVDNRFMGEKKLSMDQTTDVGLNDEQDDLLNMFDDLNVSLPDFFKKSGITPPPGLFR